MGLRRHLPAVFYRLILYAGKDCSLGISLRCGNSVFLTDLTKEKSGYGLFDMSFDRNTLDSIEQRRIPLVLHAGRYFSNLALYRCERLPA